MMMRRSTSNNAGSSDNRPTPPDQGPPQSQLYPIRLEVSTWTRDSHDLYDYESRHTTNQEFLMTENTRRFYRRDGSIIASSDSAEEIIRDVGGPAATSPIEYVLKTYCLPDGRLVITPTERERTNMPEWFHQQMGNLVAKKLWLVIKELNEYCLSEGDIIKLGRFKLRVKQLCPGPRDEVVKPEVNFEGGLVAPVAPDSDEPFTCRICLLEGTGRDEDPLIQACDCKGSIQYVHLGCLRYWIHGRLCLNEGPNRNVYQFKQLSCELCKASYPLQVQLANGSKVHMVPMPETKAPYLVLENMMRSDTQDGSNAAHARGFYLISLSGKKVVKLGRGHESDLRIPDVSISRWHASVSYREDGKFVLEDHNSKFGTLIALRKPKVVNLSAEAMREAGLPPHQLHIPETPETATKSVSDRVVVQVGRSVFAFSCLTKKGFVEQQERETRGTEPHLTAPHGAKVSSGIWEEALPDYAAADPNNPRDMRQQQLRQRMPEEQVRQRLLAEAAARDAGGEQARGGVLAGRLAQFQQMFQNANFGVGAPPLQPQQPGHVEDGFQQPRLNAEMLERLNQQAAQVGRFDYMDRHHQPQQQQQQEQPRREGLRGDFEAEDFDREED